MNNTQNAMPDLLDVPALVQRLGLNTQAVKDQLATDALRAALQEALANGEVIVRLLAGDQSKTRPADIYADRGWGGLDRVLLGIEQVCAEGGPTPLSDEDAARLRRASLLRAHWIGGDLKFLTLAYPDQWREGELRLSRLDAPLRPDGESAREALAGLGLTWALERLQRLHKTYGDTLGITSAGDLTPQQLTAWEDALDALLSGVHFHHRRDPDIYAAIFNPYEDALAASRARRAKRSTKP
jgi:hypothetical protein